MYKKLYQNVLQPVTELATLVFNHFGKSPMSWTGVDKLTEYAHNEQFVDRVLEMYSFAVSHNTLIEGINPSQFYKIIYKYQLAAKSLNKNRQLISDCYFFFANYAIRTYNHNLSRIKAQIEQYEFIQILDEETARRITSLAALLRSYSETLYCDEHTIAGEIYAPIFWGQEIMVAREYDHLAPCELYPEIANCQYKKINIYIKYRGIEGQLNTDIVGNFLVNENISKHMFSYCVEAVNFKGEAKILARTEIDEVVSFLRVAIPKIINHYRKLSTEDRLWKKIVCEYYALKPYFDTVGESWKPSKYNIDITKIVDPTRPIVEMNNEIASTNNEELILGKLIELNNPLIYWPYS